MPRTTEEARAYARAYHARNREARNARVLERRRLAAKRAGVECPPVVRTPVTAERAACPPTPPMTDEERRARRIALRKARRKADPEAFRAERAAWRERRRLRLKGLLPSYEKKGRPKNPSCGALALAERMRNAERWAEYLRWVQEQRATTPWPAPLKLPLNFARSEAIRIFGRVL